MQADGDIVIDTFRTGDQQAFDALNRAWLTEYGLLEGPDERQLTDPSRADRGAGGPDLRRPAER